MLSSQVVETFKNNGFTLKAEFKKDGKKGLLDRLYNVYYKDETVLYLRHNEDNTFSSIELLDHPSSYPKYVENTNLGRVIKILKTIVKN